VAVTRNDTRIRGPRYCTGIPGRGGHILKDQLAAHRGLFQTVQNRGKHPARHGRIRSKTARFIARKQARLLTKSAKTYGHKRTVTFTDNSKYIVKGECEILSIVTFLQ